MTWKRRVMPFFSKKYMYNILKKKTIVKKQPKGNELNLCNLK